MENKKKVFVGLSGGVDSSVSAALLKKQGFDVTGVFIKVWSPDWLPCTWIAERRDAMRVASMLDIPFITLDLEKEYKEGVVDYMISEYKIGRIPNPDVMCNKNVKFGAFLKFAKDSGADFVATGHYARRVEKGGNVKMLKGLDANKDQSYFLWTFTQKKIKEVLFPIGEYEKSKVRELAEDFGLPTATKKDSQGLCFVGKIDFKEFLKHFIKEKKGDVLDENGNKIGEHDGAVFLTVGQRHGFTTAKSGTEDKPYYIVAKNVEDNTIVVSHEKISEVYASKRIKIKNTNWIFDIPEKGRQYEAKIWYRGDLHKCRIEIINENEATVVFNEEQSVASGQSVVLYDGDICLGGGIV